MENFKTFCPLFPGFYNTVFQYDGEDSDIESYNEENGTDLGFDDFNFDYKEYEKRVGRKFVERLENELKRFLPINLTFEEIVSPREYNFRNDSINVTAELNLAELLKLIEERKEEAERYFKDTYTSCSGFISYHSNRISDWLSEEYIRENEEHRVGALLACLCSIEIDKDDIIYWTDSENWINFDVNEQN